MGNQFGRRDNGTPFIIRGWNGARRRSVPTTYTARSRINNNALFWFKFVSPYLSLSLCLCLSFTVVCSLHLDVLVSLRSRAQSKRYHKIYRFIASAWNTIIKTPNITRACVRVYRTMWKKTTQTSYVLRSQTCFAACTESARGIKYVTRYTRKRVSGVQFLGFSHCNTTFDLLNQC